MLWFDPSYYPIIYIVLYIAAAPAPPVYIIFIIACERRSKSSTTMTAPSVKKETNRKSHSRRSSLCRVRDVAVCVRSKCSLLSRCLTLSHVFGHDPPQPALSSPAVLSIPTHNGEAISSFIQRKFVWNSRCLCYYPKPSPYLGLKSALRAI